MSELVREIDAEFDENVAPPKSWEDIDRYLAEVNDRNFEASYEAHERFANPNGMSLRDMLEILTDEEVRLERLGAMFPVYLEKGLKPQEARRYFHYAARRMVEPTQIDRAIDRSLLLARMPDLEARFEKAANPANHRKHVEEAAKRRTTLEPLRFGVDELDKLIPGGIGMGKVLNIVGGEGGMKTSVALHLVDDFVRRGGKVLFISLDMSAEAIETRLLMRIMNRSEIGVMECIRADSAEYRRAKEEREEFDDLLSIVGGPLTLEQIETVVATSLADVVAIDYVSLIDGFADELSAARAATRKIRQWRTRWGVTFVLLSQMSRASRADQVKGGNGGHAIGGSSLEQLVDYEVELLSDPPLLPGDRPRLIATLRKNRSGTSGRSFELFPQFPGMSFSDKAEPMEYAKQRKPIFQNKF